jgi:hypothetical protein
MASVAFVETGEKLKVSSESVEDRLKEQRLRLEVVEWKVLRRMKGEGRLEAEMRGLRLGSVAGLSPEKSAEAAPSSSADLEDLRSGFRMEISAASETLRSEIEALKRLTLRTCRRHLDSLAMDDFPAIFEDFKDKKFTLLWRGSRDGFKAEQFHRRCDGHANTLVVILDTDGNIFGGFTPVKWESSKNGKDKADPSQKSFLFTLKNPHNFPAASRKIRWDSL